MPVTLSTLGTTLSFPRLQAQAISYNPGNTRQGIVTQAWQVLGHLEEPDAVAVGDLFDLWRATRKAEPDSVAAQSVGTTVAFTGAAAGRVWTAVPCWFDEPPTLEPLGKYWRCSFVLVDAAEALAAELALRALEQDSAAQTDFGTLQVGGVTLTLVEEPEGHGDGPQVAMNTAGYDYVTGPLRPIRLRNVAGYGPNGRADYLAIRAWYEAQVAATPARGTWFPVSPPTAEVSEVPSGSGWATRYVIRMTLRYLP